MVCSECRLSVSEKQDDESGYASTDPSAKPSGAETIYEGYIYQPRYTAFVWWQHQSDVDQCSGTAIWVCTARVLVTEKE